MPLEYTQFMAISKLLLWLLFSYINILYYLY